MVKLRHSQAYYYHSQPNPEKDLLYYKQITTVLGQDLLENFFRRDHPFSIERKHRNLSLDVLIEYNDLSYLSRPLPCNLQGLLSVSYSKATIVRLGISLYSCYFDSGN